MSISDTRQAQKFASIAEVAAAETKLLLAEVEKAPEYANEARLYAEAASASATSAQQQAEIASSAASESVSAAQASADNATTIINQQLVDQQIQFQSFLSSYGLQFIGDYEDGPLAFTARNQYIRYDNTYWQVAASTNLPFTTSGNSSTSWSSDLPSLTPVSDDDALRSALSQDSGSSLIGFTDGRSVQENITSIKSDLLADGEILDALKSRVSLASAQAIKSTVIAASAMMIYVASYSGAYGQAVMYGASNYSRASYADDASRAGKDWLDIGIISGQALIYDAEGKAYKMEVADAIPTPYPFGYTPGMSDAAATLKSFASFISLGSGKMGLIPEGPVYTSGRVNFGSNVSLFAGSATSAFPTRSDSGVIVTKINGDQDGETCPMSFGSASRVSGFDFRGTASVDYQATTWPDRPNNSSYGLRVGTDSRVSQCRFMYHSVAGADFAPSCEFFQCGFSSNWQGLGTSSQSTGTSDYVVNNCTFAHNVNDGANLRGNCIRVVASRFEWNGGHGMSRNGGETEVTCCLFDRNAKSGARFNDNAWGGSFTGNYLMRNGAGGIKSCSYTPTGVAAGSVYTITVQLMPSGINYPISYTATSSDTAATVSAALASSINSNSALSSVLTDTSALPGALILRQTTLHGSFRADTVSSNITASGRFRGRGSNNPGTDAYLVVDSADSNHVSLGFVKYITFSGNRYRSGSDDAGNGANSPAHIYAVSNTVNSADNVFDASEEFQIGWNQNYVVDADDVGGVDGVFATGPNLAKFKRSMWGLDAFLRKPAPMFTLSDARSTAGLVHGTWGVAPANGVTATCGFNGVSRYAAINNMGLEFFTSSAGSVVSRWRMDSTGVLMPIADNAYSIGDSSHRITQLYATTSTIATSDGRLKTDVRKMSDNELKAASLLAKEIGFYKWLEQVQSKGEDARWHPGMTVQRAIEVMKECDLNPDEYSFICYDKWEDSYGWRPAYDRQISDSDGNPALNSEGEPLMETVEAERYLEKEAGDLYSFRFDQLMSFIAAGFEERLSRVESALNQ